MVIPQQRILCTITGVTRQRIHKQIKQLGLRGDIQLRVGVLAMQFDRLGGDAKLFGDEPGAVS
jgi:DNA-binding transcriptional MocR family regulator